MDVDVRTMVTIACIVLALVGSAYWLLNLFAAWRVVRRVPVLADQRVPSPERWPSLSVVIPACNEGVDLEAAMRSKLSQDYPDLELVLIDDRSTDDTGAIVDRLAAEDGRVVPLHVTELPSGWLGKLHAMHIGVGRARGEWLLMSDADVHFAPDTLRRAIAFAEARGIDHLAVFPPVWSTNFVLDTCMASFARLLMVGGRPWATTDPTSRAAMGVGAFNLVRRSAFEKTGGFEWLKLEVADDFALGQMLKRSGATSAVGNGRGLLGLYFYRTIGDMARGSEKAARLFRFRVGWVLAAVLTLLVLELGLFAGFLPVGVPWLPVVAATGLLAAVASSVLIARWLGHPLVPALLAPLGSLSMAAVLLRGGLPPSLRGGLTWRGTLYPARQLLEGGRLDLG